MGTEKMKGYLNKDLFFFEDQSKLFPWNKCFQRNFFLKKKKKSSSTLAQTQNKSAAYGQTYYM